ncbi:MAG: bifunctional oligoribonuclease/PAP phosphatase NrnA [Nitrospirae bacterium]|nr:bifunctional oligoribonuclease/PAP phosphatase NrnA [Candidatus Manganitrophaceae bacterium]
MRYIVVCDDLFFYDVLKSVSQVEAAWLFLVQEPVLAKQLEVRGVPVLQGTFSNGAIFKKAKIDPDDWVLIAMADIRSLQRVNRSLASEGVQPSLVLTREAIGKPLADLRTVSCGELLSSSLMWELHAVTLRDKTRKIRRLLEEAGCIVILIQDDPDPDAIASAVALRTLLGRNKLTAPIASFGVVDRPENIAMVKRLEIEVEQIDAARLHDFDRFCFVDTQPSRFRVKFPRVDVVIDHHPEEKGYPAAFRDIRPNKGATSTLLTEYLRADDVKISQRLATALLYGIGTDTAFLERGTHPADVEAFSFLYPLANHALIRQIERPEFPQEEARFVQKAIRRWRIERKILVSHVGRVPRQDIVPRLADFCTQVEGVDWSIISGIVSGNLIVSARNMGNTGNAGGLLKEAFGRLGQAGGHRFMAKATIPLTAFRAAFRKTDERFVRDKLFDLLLEVARRGTITP